MCCSKMQKFSIFNTRIVIFNTEIIMFNEEFMLVLPAGTRGAYPIWVGAVS